MSIGNSQSQTSRDLLSLTTALEEIGLKDASEERIKKAIKNQPTLHSIYTYLKSHKSMLIQYSPDSDLEKAVHNIIFKKTKENALLCEEKLSYVNPQEGRDLFQKAMEQEDWAVFLKVGILLGWLGEHIVQQRPYEGLLVEKMSFTSKMDLLPCLLPEQITAVMHSLSDEQRKTLLQRPIASKDQELSIQEWFIRLSTDPQEMRMFCKRLTPGEVAAGACLNANVFIEVLSMKNIPKTQQLLSTKQLAVIVPLLPDDKLLEILQRLPPAKMSNLVQYASISQWDLLCGQLPDILPPLTANTKFEEFQEGFASLRSALAQLKRPSYLHSRLIEHEVQLLHDYAKIASSSDEERNITFSFEHLPQGEKPALCKALAPWVSDTPVPKILPEEITLLTKMGMKRRYEIHNKLLFSLFNLPEFEKIFKGTGLAMMTKMMSSGKLIENLQNPHQALELIELYYSDKEALKALLVERNPSQAHKIEEGFKQLSNLSKWIEKGVDHKPSEEIEKEIIRDLNKELEKTNELEKCIIENATSESLKGKKRLKIEVIMPKALCDIFEKEHMIAYMRRNPLEGNNWEKRMLEGIADGIFAKIPPKILKKFDKAELRDAFVEGKLASLFSHSIFLSGWMPREAQGYRKAANKAVREVEIWHEGGI